MLVIDDTVIEKIDVSDFVKLLMMHFRWLAYYCLHRDV